jgi:hypothetical protein
MDVIEFKSSLASRADDGIVVALFDGPKVCVAILRCTEEAAAELHKELGSVLKPGA